MGSMVVVMVALTLASAPSAGTQLRTGIQRYDAGDYRGALEALTSALEHARKRRTRAQIHVYVGLIQVRYGLEKDARGSFKAALEQSRRTRLPPKSPAKARRLFRKIRTSMGLSRGDRPRRRRASSTSPKPARESPPPNPPAVPPIDDEVPTKRVARPATPTNANDNRAGDSARTPPIAPAPTAEGPASTGGSASAGLASAAPTPDQDLQLSVPMPGPPPAPSAEARLNEPAEAPRNDRIGAWTLLGVGVAGIVTGVVFEALAISNQQAARDAATAVRAEELTDRFQTQERVAWVGLGVGAALTVGATLWLTLD